jgi:type IV fimbrial biogenesis protein FimT
MMIGVPSYRYVTNTNRTASEVNGLLGDLQYARGEAIKEGQTVTACISVDGATCSAGSTNWETGWIVFSDLNDDQTVDPGDTVLRVQKPFASFGSSDTLTAGNAVGAVSFNREGFASNVPNGTLITLYTAPIDSRWTRCRSITTVGLIATATYGNPTPGGNCT